MENTAMYHTPYPPYGFGYGDNDRHDDNGLGELILSNHVANGHQNLANQVHTASINNQKETSDAARDVVDAVRDATEATNQIGNINLQSSERNGGENRASIERAAGTTRDVIYSTANQADRDRSRIVSEICDVRQQISDNFGNTNLEMAKQHSEIKLELTKQHCELSRQLAECCCELKTGQVEIRNEVVAQAAANREQDLKRELDNQRQELLLLKIGNGPGQGN